MNNPASNAPGSPTAGTLAERPDAASVGQTLTNTLTLPELAQLIGEHALGSAEYTTDELLAAVGIVRHTADGMHHHLSLILRGEADHAEA